MKKYRVKNYKGHIIESISKFAKAHKSERIVEAIEDELGLSLSTVPAAAPAAAPEVEAHDTAHLDLILAFGAKLLAFGLEAHFWHLNCFKNAEHLALKDLYEACDDVGDRLLENAIGSTMKPAIPSLESATYEYSKECIAKIEAIISEATSLIDGADAGIDNILGEFCETCGSIVYKLKHLE